MNEQKIALNRILSPSNSQSIISEVLIVSCADVRPSGSRNFERCAKSKIRTEALHHALVVCAGSVIRIYLAKNPIDFFASAGQNPTLEKPPEFFQT